MSDKRFLLPPLKEAPMSRFLGRIVILLIVTALVASAPLLAGGSTSKDIDRSYGFTCSGTTATGPVTQIGQVSCESRNDTCSATFIQNVGGTEVTFPASGAFTLDKNTGLGFITYDVGPGLFFLPVRFVVLENGKEIRGMPIVPDYNVLCELKAQ
jgi:hypothetical protein